jgi:hypothetical protein
MRAEAWDAVEWLEGRALLSASAMSAADVGDYAPADPENEDPDAVYCYPPVDILPIEPPDCWCPPPPGCFPYDDGTLTGTWSVYADFLGSLQLQLVQTGKRLTIRPDLSAFGLPDLPFLSLTGKLKNGTDFSRTFKADLGALGTLKIGLSMKFDTTSTMTGAVGIELLGQSFLLPFSGEKHLICILPLPEPCPCPKPCPDPWPEPLPLPVEPGPIILPCPAEESAGGTNGDVALAAALAESTVADRMGNWNVVVHDGPYSWNGFVVLSQSKSGKKSFVKLLIPEFPNLKLRTKAPLEPNGGNNFKFGPVLGSVDFTGENSFAGTLQVLKYGVDWTLEGSKMA